MKDKDTLTLNEEDETKIKNKIEKNMGGVYCPLDPCFWWDWGGGTKVEGSKNSKNVASVTLDGGKGKVSGYHHSINLVELG